MKNKVTVIVDGHEGDGSIDCEVIELKIGSHWNYDTLVHLNIGGKEYTFLAAMLIDAIERCSR